MSRGEPLRYSLFCLRFSASLRGSFTRARTGYVLPRYVMIPSAFGKRPGDMGRCIF